MSGEGGYTLRYLVEARQDAQLILAHLSGYYPSTPAKFAAELKKCEQTLATNPRLHPVWQENPAYRRAVVQQYLVFYQVVEEQRRVDVYRILHGAQDLRRFLRDTGQSL